LDDFSASPYTNLWTDTVSSGFSEQKAYVVQTNTEILKRCVIMTTDPGDIVLDPTCGSGTTAYVSEQWGRRWIAIDTSRVAIAIARQRLLTGKFDYYRLRPTTPEDIERNPSAAWLADPDKQQPGLWTLDCKRVPHITLKSVAQNSNLDPILAKHEPILDEHLVIANEALGRVTEAIRTQLTTKLVHKEREDGKRAITDADRRRWELPKKGHEWKHW